MKRFLNRIRSTDGFSLIELLMVITIIGILAGIVTMTYDVLTAKIRFSRVRADMDLLASAGYADYTTNLKWAPLQAVGIPLPFVTSNSLQEWPHPPCPGWSYTWDNWIDFNGVNPLNVVVRIAVRNAVGKPIYVYCLDNLQGAGNCMFIEGGFGSAPYDISNPPLGARAIYCNEQ